MSFQKQKSPAFTGRLGIKGHINPHMVLTPKTVRETSRQVFWLSLICRPSHPEGSGQWILSGRCVDPASSRAGITAAGPLPIYTGFPSPRCVRYVIMPTLYHTLVEKVKTYPNGILSSQRAPCSPQESNSQFEICTPQSGDLHVALYCTPVTRQRQGKDE